jgi:hypothetical protein
MWCASSRRAAIVIPPRRSDHEVIRKMLPAAKRWCYTPAMTVKSAAFFALIGMILLTVLLALGFIRDISGFMGGAVAAMALLISLIHLLASLSVAVFLYVFYKAQS